MGALRVCVSASAAERLSCARDVIRACAPGTRVLIVGASRGAADDLAREVAASAPATFGLQRLSLTQLAARTAILRAGRTGPDVEHLARRRSGGGARGLRRDARRVARVFRRRSRARPDFRARSRERCRSCGWPACAARSSRRFRWPGPTSPICSSASSVVCRRVDARIAPSCFAPPRGRWSRRAPVADVVVLLDLALEHAAERELVSAAGRGECEVDARDGPARRSSTSVAYLEAIGGSRRAARRPAATDDLACLRRFLFNRRGAAGRARARRLARVLLGARRGTRVRRDRAAHPDRGAARRALRRDGDPRAIAAQLLRSARTRADAAPVCRRGSTAARGGRIPRPRVPGAARVRR